MAEEEEVEDDATRTGTNVSKRVIQGSKNSPIRDSSLGIEV